MIRLLWLPRLTKLVLGAVLLFGSAHALTPDGIVGQPVLSEQFNELDNWKPLEFPLQTNSHYQTTPEGLLCAQSDSSVSAIVLAEKFKPAQSPILRWSWSVNNTFAAGNAQSKDGDDFPMRVSVCFKFDPKKVSDNERRWFNMQKLIWGEYPPYRVLHYVYASRNDLPSNVLDCPYSDRARIIVKRAGEGQLNQWHEEKVNIMEDFRRAFGEEPPEEAVISIMADSDNTKETSTAYLDWIELSTQ